MAGSDDQLVRELIQAFPAGFVRLVLRAAAARTDLAAVDFRQEEYFTDSPRGGRPRRPDLMARVAVSSGGEVILQGEIEARYRSARLPGISDDNRLLTPRYGLPVHTVVLYCRGGPPGLQSQEVRHESLGQTVAVFPYVSLGLSGIRSAEYLARPEPLAWAFAALAQPGKLGSLAELRVACLRRIVEEPALEEGRRFLLFNFVASYIESDRGVSEEYDELLQSQDNRRVHETMMTWAEKMEAKGLAKGEARGRRAGEAALLTKMAERRFGPLSAEARRAIDGADDDQLLEWGERILTARSVDEIFDGKG